MDMDCMRAFTGPRTLLTSGESGGLISNDGASGESREHEESQLGTKCNRTRSAARIAKNSALIWRLAFRFRSYDDGERVEGMRLQCAMMSAVRRISRCLKNARC